MSNATIGFSVTGGNFFSSSNSVNGKVGGLHKGESGDDTQLLQETEAVEYSHLGEYFLLRKCDEACTAQAEGQSRRPKTEFLWLREKSGGTLTELPEEKKFPFVTLNPNVEFYTSPHANWHSEQMEGSAWCVALSCELPSSHVGMLEVVEWKFLHSKHLAMSTTKVAEILYGQG